MRANILAFFGLASVVTGLTFWANDMFSAEIGRHALLIIPIYALAIGIGVRLFRGADGGTFRFIALAICATIAVVALPIWF